MTRGSENEGRGMGQEREVGRESALLQRKGKRGARWSTSRNALCTRGECEEEGRHGSGQKKSGGKWGCDEKKKTAMLDPTSTMTGKGKAVSKKGSVRGI